MCVFLFALRTCPMSEFARFSLFYFVYAEIDVHVALNSTTTVINLTSLVTNPFKR